MTTTVPTRTWIEAPRTLLHGIGAAAITLLAFGAGPLIGAMAPTPDTYVVQEFPVEGSPTATIDLDTLEALLAAPEAVEEEAEEPVEEVLVAATGAEDVGVDALEEVLPEVAEVEPAVADVAPRPAPRPAAAGADEDEEEAEEGPSLMELALARKAPKRRGRKCEPDPNPRIQRDAKGTFTVEKDLVTWYVGHLRELNSLGWSSKEEGPDGKSVGMRIGGVKCGNDLHLAGIRSGDVVHRVNGHDVRSIPQAILVYGKVRKDHVIEVELTRRGKPMTLTYRLS